MNKLLFALPRTAVKHEMMACRAAPRGGVANRASQPAFATLWRLI
jgi:hypothetical protein